MSNATEREYVEAAACEFRMRLESLVAEYRRNELDVRDVLGDAAEFASRAVGVAASSAPGAAELPPGPASG